MDANDPQQRLLTEIRDILREQLEQYKRVTSQSLEAQQQGLEHQQQAMKHQQKSWEGCCQSGRDYRGCVHLFICPLGLA